MAGNSQRQGAMRRAGTKKGQTVGSGGQRRKQLEGKGPTPKAEDRPYHAAHKRKRAAEKAAAKGGAGKAGAGKAGGTRPSRSSSRSTDATFLIGRNPVLEGLQAGVPGKTLYLQARLESDDRWRDAVKLAVAAGIPVSEVTRTDLDRMTDGVHQGIALAVPPYVYADVDDLAAEGTLLVALDSITDPHNLGAIARSAAAFGASGIVIPSRRAAGVTATAWKASAGALSRLPIAQVTNLTRTLESLKKQGFTVIGLDGSASTGFEVLPAGTLADPVVFVIGSEGEGLSRLVAETCDWRVRIDMRSGNESLNASVAAGIALHTTFTARSK